jgi:broad specificity phosphatase PhoE
MTDFWLVRHGSTDTLDVGIAGCQPGVMLNALGQREVAALAARLAESGVRLVYTSPLERARLTAGAIAARLGCEVRPQDDLIELQFGDWTGLSFEALARDPDWHLFNSFRSGTRIPNGETMLEVQARAMAALLQLRRTHPDERLIVVTHGDVIKAIVCHVLGMPLDFHDRLDIAPASLTRLSLHPHGVRLSRLNDVGHLGSLGSC